MIDDSAIALQGARTLAAIVAGGAVLIGGLRFAKGRRSPSAGGDAQPAKKIVPLWLRLGTLLVLAVIVFVPAYVGPLHWTAVVGLLVAMGLHEFWGMLATQGVAAHRMTGSVAALSLVAAAAWGGVAAIGPALVGCLLLVMPAALFSRRADPLPARMSGTLLGVLYVGLLGAFLVILRQGEGGFGHLLFFLMVIQLADVGGLVGGVAFGKHPMVPRLSPGKTWEGTVCSFLAAIGAAWLFAFALPGAPLMALLAIGAAFAVTGLVGDLLASGFKRAAGLKDFGWVLPGHGGVLDRFDGYLFSAPAAWALYSLLPVG